MLVTDNSWEPCAGKQGEHHQGCSVVHLELAPQRLLKPTHPPAVLVGGEVGGGLAGAVAGVGVRAAWLAAPALADARGAAVVALQVAWRVQAGWGMGRVNTT